MSFFHYFRLECLYFYGPTIFSPKFASFFHLRAIISLRRQTVVRFLTSVREIQDYVLEILIFVLEFTEELFEILALIHSNHSAHKYHFSLHKYSHRQRVAQDVTEKLDKIPNFRDHYFEIIALTQQINQAEEKIPRSRYPNTEYLPIIFHLINSSFSRN